MGMDRTQGTTNMANVSNNNNLEQDIMLRMEVLL
jgi:hypothetical protein